jgi:hypothetical protein
VGKHLNWGCLKQALLCEDCFLTLKSSAYARIIIVVLAWKVDSAKICLHYYCRIHKVSCMLQKTMYGANVIIFEGILAFYHAEILKVGVYTSSY